MWSLFGFSIQQFFICLFNCQKIAFVCEFQHTPLWIFFFPRCSTFFVDMRLLRHVPKSLRNKISERHIPYSFQKMVFVAFKTLWHGERTILSTWNVMNLQIIRNECIRFGGHAHIEVSYKILWLEVLAKAPNFSPYF